MESKAVPEKKSKPTLVASSTPQRPMRPTTALPVEKDGDLLNELLTGDPDDDEESDHSDPVQGTDEEDDDQQTNNQLRQRRPNPQ